jgi:hypothetical protein
LKFRKEIYEFVGNFYMEKELLSHDSQWVNPYGFEESEVKQPISRESGQTTFSAGTRFFFFL